MHDLLDPADAVVWVGEAGFEVWLGREGLRRMKLPGLGPALAALEKESEPTVRIDIQKETEPGDADLLGELAVFLIAALAGRGAAPRPAVDLEGVPPFTRRALEAVAAIPPGWTESYARIAAKAGRPGAARAAGQALARNPVPLVIPCHRVVRSDGSAGGWSGAPGWKEWLLETERRGAGSRG